MKFYFEHSRYLSCKLFGKRCRRNNHRKKLILLLIELKSLAVIQNKAAYPIDKCISIFILKRRWEEHSLEFVQFCKLRSHILDSWGVGADTVRKQSLTLHLLWKPAPSLLCNGLPQKDVEEFWVQKKNVLSRKLFCEEVEENCEFYCQRQHRNAAPRVIVLQRMSPER